MGPLFCPTQRKNRRKDFVKSAFSDGGQGVILVCSVHPFASPLEEAMRDIHQLLREKELEIIRVRQEIEALRAIIPLLEDDDDSTPAATTPHYAGLRAVNQE